MVTDGKVDEGYMDKGSEGRVDKGEYILCSTFGVGRDDKDKGSEGREDNALDTASS